MSGLPAQMVFDLAPRPALGAEDFLVSSANAAALRLIDDWPHWPHHAVVLAGPAQAGKSHLGNVWRMRSAAAVVAAREVSGSDVGLLTSAGALLVENLEQGVGDETALFHLLNAARERQLSLLMTTRRPPAEIEIQLPDLASRLRAVPIVTIAPPDEALLRALLVKHFADRQLAVEPPVIAYLAVRMERSMAMAETIVAALDVRALATHRRVTRALAAETLTALGQNAGDGLT